ncbi:MAG: hypothetical protein JO257_14290 [Deltaproteobacteria bacterium]|nr:hypothetical protein [Deltaproteobacteria bacterium]
MRASAAVLLAVAACGRFGFDSVTGDGALPSGDGSGSGSASGVRWAVTIGNNAFFVPVGGENGTAIAAYPFRGTTTAVGQTLTGIATNLSSAVVRIDATGNLVAATVLDSATTCDIRGVGMQGDTVLLAGLAFGDGNMTVGPCNVAVGRQAPIILGVDSAGTITRPALGMPVGMNAQAWNVRVLPDSTFVISGIYSGGLQFGAVSLPPAGADPNGYVAHLSGSQADPLWTIALDSAASVTPGPIAIEGTDLCMLGGYVGSVSLYGSALPSFGSSDALIVRIDSSGNTKFVRGFGSTGMESDFNDGAVVAVNGGCVGAIKAPADVTIGSTTMLASDGPGIVVWFDSTGALLGGYRVPSLAGLAHIGTRVIAAYTVTTPITIGSMTFTPQGSDIVLVELDANGPVQLLDVIGGAGDQSLIRMAAIAPDAVALTLASSGDFQAGSIHFTSAPNDRVLAAVGF